MDWLLYIENTNNICAKWGHTEMDGGKILKDSNPLLIVPVPRVERAAFGRKNNKLEE